ncbi:hypothetical protein TNCV_1732771 [Trichonephila clavipes]|nr:hypothetical protein TNCV_1732771 [Trichonephila clavipes]
MSIKAIAGFICVCMMVTLAINIENTKAAPFMGGHHGGGDGGVLPILAAGAVNMEAWYKMMSKMFLINWAMGAKDCTSWMKCPEIYCSSYTRAFGYGPRNFEPRSRDVDDI